MNNVLKTFEMFLSLPLSIIRKGLVQVMHVETEGNTIEKSLSVITQNDVTSINVVNNYKMYNLLTSVMYKRQMYEKNNAGKIHY
ncbi:hypothetical protein IJE86_07380 [bacterium]|nr:hypothetical protein [bacterium]